MKEVTRQLTNTEKQKGYAKKIRNQFTSLTQAPQGEENL
jgi:hypothetical protein